MDGVIAYFSMEVALEAGMPTYSGGLGVLAGDTVRAGADLKVPMVGVTLLYRRGYFFQHISPEGNQEEEPVHWSVDDFLTPTDARVTVTLAGREVQVAAWRFDVTGVGGHVVPVFFLDTDLPANHPEDRTLTDRLYGGDAGYRIRQEAVLGIGGARMLPALGYSNVVRYHMNEGHAAFLALELLAESAQAGGREAPGIADVEVVRKKCVFTTHTPVPAGHDKFSLGLLAEVLGERPEFSMEDVFCCEGEVNMTFLALNLSHYVNGVAKRHGEVSRRMFARWQVDAITNGVHVATWAAPSFAALFDRHVPGWREDAFSLRYALGIPGGEVWDAHRRAKRDLVAYVNRERNAGFDADALTLGFARRMTAYKRPELLFHDVARLRKVAENVGPLQVVFSGKAHPQDAVGKHLIRQVVGEERALGDGVRVAYLPNYDLALGRLITAGVDVWLNTPQPPLEASGTSGMKAAVNGVPSLSVPDGWWLEGCIEGVTGWNIGTDGGQSPDPDEDALSLYEKLENQVAPLFYGPPESYADVMRHVIALNASFFNAQRMLQQYVLKAYFL